MAVIHCLFWIQNYKITSLLYEQNKLEIMKMEGKKSIPFTSDFQDKWKEYSGMCSGDQVDLCLIYDETSDIREHLALEPCDDRDCIWSRKKIEDAVRMIEITKPTEIRNKNGFLIAKAGNFMNVQKENIVTMTAWYTTPCPDEETDVKSQKTTALVQHYKDELQLYKENYEK